MKKKGTQIKEEPGSEKTTVPFNRDIHYEEHRREEERFKRKSGHLLSRPQA